MVNHKGGRKREMEEQKPNWTQRKQKQNDRSKSGHINNNIK